MASFPSAAAFAQPASLAEQLYELGKEKELAGAFDEACALFEASVKIEAKPASRLKVAACWEREGKVTAAAAELRALLEIARTVPEPHGPEIQEDIKHRLAAVERKVAKLRVTAPEDVPFVVFVDGKRVSEGAVREGLALDPGQHRLEVSAAGRAEPQVLQIANGEEKTIDVGPLVAGRMERPVPGAKTETQTAGPLAIRPAFGLASPTPWQSVAGVGLVTLGVASLGGAAALGLHALEAGSRVHTPEDEKMRRTAEDGQYAALVCLGAGLTLAAAGVTVLVLSPSKPRDSIPVVRASVSARGAGLQMIW